MNSFGLGITVSAKNQASPALGEAERSLNSLEKSARRALGGFFAMQQLQRGFQVGMSFLKGAFAMTGDARQFEVTMSQLGVISEASAEQMLIFRKAAMDAGLESLHGPQEMADAMKQLAQSGYDAESSIKMAKDALRLMTASGGDIKDITSAARVLSMIQKTWPEEAAGGLDKIAKMANMTTAEFHEMETLISHVMRGTGMKPTLDQTFALTGFVRNLSANMESAATNVGVIMERLQARSHTKAIEALGVKVYDETAKRFRQPLDILYDLYSNDKFKALGRGQGELLQKAFGSRQNVGLNALFNQLQAGQKVNGVLLQGADLIKYYTESIKNAAGESKKFEDAMLNTYDGLMKTIDATQKLIRIEVGEALMNAVKPLLQFVLPVLRAIGRALEMLPAQVKVVIAQVVLFGAVATTVALGLGAVFAGLAATLAIIGPEIVLGIGAALLVVVPIVGGLAAGIGLVGAALYAAFGENMSGIASGFGAFIENAKLGFQVLGQLINQGGTSGDVDRQIMDPKNRGLLDFLMGVWLWMNRIKNFAENMWEGFKEGLREMSGPMQGLMETFDGLLQMFGVSAGSVKSNEQAYRDWGTAGKQLGVTLATLANVGMVMITGAIKALMLMMDAVSQMLENYGYSGPLGMKKFGNDAKFYGQMLSGHPLDAYETSKQGDVIDIQNAWLKEHPDKQGTKGEWADFVSSRMATGLSAFSLGTGGTGLEDMSALIGQGPPPVAGRKSSIQVPDIGPHPGVANAEAMQTVVMNQSKLPKNGDMVFYNTVRVGEAKVHEEMTRVAHGDWVRSGLTPPEFGR